MGVRPSTRGLMRTRAPIGALVMCSDTVMYGTAGFAGAGAAAVVVAGLPAPGSRAALAGAGGTAGGVVGLAGFFSPAAVFNSAAFGSAPLAVGFGLAAVAPLPLP